MEIDEPTELAPLAVVDALLDAAVGADRIIAMAYAMKAQLLDRSDEPAELEGYGPIDGETARRIAAEAPEFRRILTDPHTGVKLSLGRERYRPTENMRLWLRIRNRTCRFPGCSRRAAPRPRPAVTPGPVAGTPDRSGIEKRGSRTRS